jgi:hypothetical protein
VKARIDIGEMMTNYFTGGERFKEGQRPSPEQMREMGTDINAKLGTLLAKYDLTVDEYRKRSPEVFADEAAVKRYLNEHPDLKQRYDALRWIGWDAVAAAGAAISCTIHQWSFSADHLPYARIELSFSRCSARDQSRRGVAVKPGYRLIIVDKAGVLVSEFQLTENALAQPEAFVASIKQAIEDVEDEEL